MHVRQVSNDEFPVLLHNNYNLPSNYLLKFQVTVGKKKRKEKKFVKTALMCTDNYSPSAKTLNMYCSVALCFNHWLNIVPVLPKRLPDPPHCTLADVSWLSGKSLVLPQP